MEIESPGRFPGLANPAHPLDISRFARNPRIARVCADLRIGQELGEGIRRIFEEMRRVGLTDPVYEQGQASLRLRLTSMSRLDPRTAARLPSRAQDILDALRVAGRDLGTGELVQSLGLSRPAVKLRLDALEREGSSDGSASRSAIPARSGLWWSDYSARTLRTLPDGSVNQAMSGPPLRFTPFSSVIPSYCRNATPFSVSSSTAASTSGTGKFSTVKAAGSCAGPFG
ncbi:helix-turn-helix domain-containing protein [Curtobacterium sp. 24E2]|nr:helix-turn-helix domain-containing protein [Curtobacterium sp. 24E2]